MVKIREKLCPASKYGIKCPYSRTPNSIVIHNTANDAPAENEITYMIGNDNEVSYHFAVDDKEIVQGLPLDRNAWASGDGHGAGNMNGIHIEICYSLSGGPKFEQAEKNAAELTAYLLKQYGWGMDRVKKHQDFDGKYCPHRTLDLGWQRFLKMVEGYMKAEPAGSGDHPSSWAKPATEWAKKQDIFKGDGQGNYDWQKPLTREQAAQILFNMENKK